MNDECSVVWKMEISSTHTHHEGIKPLILLSVIKWRMAVDFIELSFGSCAVCVVRV